MARQARPCLRRAETHILARRRRFGEALNQNHSSVRSKSTIARYERGWSNSRSATARPFAPMILRSDACPASFAIYSASARGSSASTFTPKPSAETFERNSGLEPVLTMGLPLAR